MHYLLKLNFVFSKQSIIFELLLITVKNQGDMKALQEITGSSSITNFFTKTEIEAVSKKIASQVSAENSLNAYMFLKAQEYQIKTLLAELKENAIDQAVSLKKQGEDSAWEGIKCSLTFPKKGCEFSDTILDDLNSVKDNLAKSLQLKNKAIKDRQEWLVDRNMFKATKAKGETTISVTINK